MYAVLVLALVLQTANNAPSHPKEPIGKNISTNLHKNQTSDKAKGQPLPVVAKTAPSDQGESAQKANGNENYPQGVTYRIETSPQTSDSWTKWYVIATFVIAALNFGMLLVIWSQLSIMRLEQRAWVFISPPHLETISDKVEIKIRIGNAGHTPAKAVVRFIDIAWAERGSVPVFDFKEPKGASAVVFPRCNVFAYTDKPCPNDIHLKINSGEFFI
jgi:hypothetical protein